MMLYERRTTRYGYGSKVDMLVQMRDLSDWGRIMQIVALGYNVSSRIIGTHQVNSQPTRVYMDSTTDILSVCPQHLGYVIVVHFAKPTILNWTKAVIAMRILIFIGVPTKVSQGAKVVNVSNFFGVPVGEVNFG